MRKMVAVLVLAGLAGCSIPGLVPRSDLDLARPEAAAGATIAASDVATHDLSAQRRRGTRLRVYRPSRYLPPDARRQCVSQLVQEHRPAGVVIVPRTTCWWQRG